MEFFHLYTIFFRHFIKKNTWTVQIINDQIKNNITRFISFFTKTKKKKCNRVFKIYSIHIQESYLFSGIFVYITNSKNL